MAKFNSATVHNSDYMAKLDRMWANAPAYVNEKRQAFHSRVYTLDEDEVMGTRTYEFIVGSSFDACASIMYTGVDAQYPKGKTRFNGIEVTMEMK